MPFYFDFYGVDGKTSLNDEAIGGMFSGASPALSKSGGGSVLSTAGSTYAGGSNGGIWKTTDFLDPVSPKGVYLSRIFLPNAAGGDRHFVDAREANAAGRARMLFSTAGGFSSPKSAVLSVSRHNQSGSLNNLRQMAASGGRFDSQGRLLVGTSSDIWRNVLEIKFFGATFSNLSTNPAAAGDSEGVFSVSLNFARVECREIPSKK